MRRDGWLFAITLVCAACVRSAPVLTPSAAERRPTAAERMLEAAALVRAGCLDCLATAYRQYEALAADPAVGGEAAGAAVRTAALISVRERELGIVESGTLDEARALADRHALSAPVAPLFDIIETLGARGTAGSGPVSSDAQLRAATTASRNRDAWTAALRARADADALTAYLWVAFSCSYNNPTSDQVDTLTDALPTWKATPLIRFRLASCATLQISSLEALQIDDPRFVEVGYYTGLQSLILGDMEAAEAHLARANTWRPRWAAVTSLRAGAFMTVEDFDRAVDLYGRTLELVPDHVEALLGRIKALIFLGRYDEALVAVDALLALEQWYIGDAYYWRAMAEQHLGRYDPAWDSIERAAKLITNADVAKLAGIIAVQRQQPVVAREKFEEAYERNPSDCETSYFLGSVRAEQQSWAESVDAFTIASTCFDGSRRGLEADIERIRASALASDRQARQIARREQRIASEERMRMTAWFNTAVASFNLSRYADARQYAERVADDAQFRDRVRVLLARLPSGAR